MDGQKHEGRRALYIQLGSLNEPTPYAKGSRLLAILTRPATSQAYPSSQVGGPDRLLPLAETPQTPRPMVTRNHRG